MTPLPRSAEAPVVDEGPRTGPPDALVLDIGGDVGALILYADEDLIGREIDITPAGEHHHHGVHTAIRRRRAADRDTVCGVYPELKEGAYTVWGLDGSPIAHLRIEGGSVREYNAGDCRTVDTNQRLSADDPGCLEVEQGLLVVETAAIAGERSVGADHAMAGHHDGDRVAAIGQPHRP